MKNEAYDLLQRIAASESGQNMHFLGSATSANEVVAFIQHGSIYLHDAPDLLITKGSDALIIEHFEFDSCHIRRKGGSPSKRELDRIQKMEDAMPATEEGAFLHDEIKAKSSYSDYLQNVTNGFNKHYKHIAMYKENLLKEGLIDQFSNIKVLFLIEDTTILGATAVSRDRDDIPLRHVMLAHCKPFLDLLQKSVEVDYVLACSSADNKDHSWFIDRTQLSEYYKHVVDYECMDFLDFTPQVTGFKILISEDEMVEED